MLSLFFPKFDGKFLSVRKERYSVNVKETMKTTSSKAVTKVQNLYTV